MQFSEDCLIVAVVVVVDISGDIRVAMTVSPASADSTHFKISDTHMSHPQEGITVITPVIVYECRRVIIVVTKSLHLRRSYSL